MQPSISANAINQLLTLRSDTNDTILNKIAEKSHLYNRFAQFILQYTVLP